MSNIDCWVELPEYPGYRCKLIQRGNTTIRVFRPIMTDTVRKRREQQIMSAVGRILRKYDNAEETNETYSS